MSGEDVTSDYGGSALPGEHHAAPHGTEGASLRPLRSQPHEFVKGPIWLRHIELAALEHSKSTLCVLLMCYFESGRKRSDTIYVTKALRGRFNLERPQLKAGLKRLAELGILEVRKVGSRYEVLLRRQACCTPR